MNKITHWFIIGTFVLLYFIVSIISTIHVIDFFRLSNPNWLAIALAIAFEIGAAASLASIIILKKTSKVLVWSLFIILTMVQAMGNTYYAFSNLENYQSWVELFGLIEEEEIAQKRILSIISGAILPLVALGFIKSLVDYIKPEDDKNYKDDKNTEEDVAETVPRDAVGDMEKEVDRLLPYKDKTEREVIKEQIKSKMLELVKKEKDNISPEKKIDTDLNTHHTSINKKESESEKLKEDDYKKEPQEPHAKKPLNKKRPFKKNENYSGYESGI